MTGKELILATKPFAKEMRSKSWYYTISTLLLLLSALIGTLLIPYILPRLVCSVLSGLLMVRMFVIYHDHQHHAILHRSHLANTIMFIYGIYVLAPTSIWKRSHDYHHKHNSKFFSASIGSYPIVSKDRFLSMSDAERRIYLITRHGLTILFGYFSMFIVGMCLNSFLSSPKRHIDSLIALIVHITASTLVIWFLGWETWLFCIFIPFFIASCIGAYLFYAQHNFPAVHFSCNEEWKYELAAMESSSYIPMHPIFAWFFANIGYHHIHHLNSRIPFYRLPEAMKRIPELQKARTTHLSFKDIKECLRLKVWDQDSKQMVGINKIKYTEEIVK